MYDEPPQRSLDSQSSHEYEPLMLYSKPEILHYSPFVTCLITTVPDSHPAPPLLKLYRWPIPTKLKAELYSWSSLLHGEVPINPDCKCLPWYLGLEAGLLQGLTSPLCVTAPRCSSPNSMPVPTRWRNPTSPSTPLPRDGQLNNPHHHT